MDSQQQNAKVSNDVIQAARKYDKNALATLCTAYYPEILRFMTYRTGINSAEDLTGEVMVKIMKSIHKQTGRFEPWLYRLARNVIIDNARYRNSRPETEMDDNIIRMTADDRQPQQDACIKMDVQTALKEVSDEHRDFLTLKFIQGLNNSEIGEITGQSLNAVRAMQFRALKAMKQALAKEGNAIQ